jgi:hypothetical protein
MLVTLEELAMSSGVSEVDLEQVESGERVPLNGAWSGLPGRLASRRASYRAGARALDRRSFSPEPSRYRYPSVSATKVAYNSYILA